VTLFAKWAASRHGGEGQTAKPKMPVSNSTRGAAKSFRCDRVGAFLVAFFDLPQVAPRRPAKWRIEQLYCSRRMA
jgi:hypothetical protein